MDLVEPNFRVHELTALEIASRFPGDRELRAAVYLARQVLQPIRNEFGQLSPNSVFRSQALELQGLRGSVA